GEIPLAERVANEPEIVMVAAHPRIEPGPLVDPQRLLEETSRFAPFAQALVDQTQIVEDGHLAVEVVDAPEGRRGVLQPLDRFGVAAETCVADAESVADLTHHAVVVAVAERPISVERVAAAATVAAELDLDSRHERRHARIETTVAQNAADGARFLQGGQGSGESAAPI